MEREREIHQMREQLMEQEREIYQKREELMEQERRMSYMDCTKNQSTVMGRHVVDGCRKYIRDESRPGSFTCATCRCNRSYHRLLFSHQLQIPPTTAAATSQPTTTVGPSQPTFEAAPPMTVAVQQTQPAAEGQKQKRRKFTNEQKARMWSFAGKIGWRIPYAGGGGRGDEAASADEVQRFCLEIGVARQEFKDWMKNHRPLFLHQQQIPPTIAAASSQPTIGGEPAAEGQKQKRTKFTNEQKGRMWSFAEQIGWRMPYAGGGGCGDEAAAEEVQRFCLEIGVAPQVFKDWMKNHLYGRSGGSTGGGSSSGDNAAAAASSTSPAPDSGGARKT